MNNPGLWTPRRVQELLDKREYKTSEDACFLPEDVISGNKGTNCLGGVITAAYLLKEKHGTEIMFLLSCEIQEEGDYLPAHSVYTFKENGKYGAIGKSRYDDMTWREPVYETKRDLALSYEEPMIKHAKDFNWATFDLMNLDIDIFSCGDEETISNAINSRVPRAE